nr:hypothetical protein [Adlercreutzia sp. ZJ305]
MRHEAVLIVLVVEAKRLEGGVHIPKPPEVHIHGFVYLIICNTSDDKIIVSEGAAPASTLADEVNPASIVLEKLKNAEIREIVVELVDVEDGPHVLKLPFAESPAFGLLFERSEIEASAKVKIAARPSNIRMMYDAG